MTAGDAFIDKEAVQCRVFNIASGEADEAGRIPVVVSTDAVVTMPDGSEILLHTPDAVDLTRAPLPIIATHKNGQINVGVVEDITLSAGQMRGWARFGTRSEAIEYANDVAAKIIRSVSVGYIRVKGYIRSDDVLVTTRWIPRHAALIAEPADPGAGFYRAQQDENYMIERVDPLAEETLHLATPEPQSRASVIDIPAPSAGAQPSQGDRSMNENQAPAAEQQTAQSTPAARSIEVIANTGPATIAAERERMRDIRATGRQLGMAELADKAIDDGMSVGDFRALAINKLQDTGKLRQAESPELGMSTKDVEKFSFCRAILAASDPINAATLAPFEMECSRAVQNKREDKRSKDRESAITIPVDVLNRGIGLTSDIAASVQRMFAGRMAMQRDLTVGAATAGGNVVATELLGSSFIELLRHAMIIDRLGVTWLKDLVGNIAIPSQTGAATGYWVTEGNPPTESQQTIGQVPLTPKTVGGFTDYSRKLLLQASIDVEAFVRADLATIIGLTIQAAAFNGSGSGAEPTGVLNTVGIGSVAGGTNGLAPTYEHMVDLESAIGNANADVGTMAYVTNSKVRGKLRKTQEFASTNGKAIWSRGLERGVGDVLGYDAHVTNAMPSNLTKGTASGICSAIAFGNWASMLIGMWGGLDLVLDPYALATSGGRRVIALQDLDIAFRHVESFAAMKDALTA